jgi:hypothetical protein
MNKYLTNLLAKLKLSPEKLTPEETETFESWEQILSTGDEAERLMQNEAFKKSRDMAEKRLVDLFTQLLNPENSRDKDLYLKAEMNHLLNTFVVFKGLKSQSDIIEAQIKQRLE